MVVYSQHALISGRTCTDFRVHVVNCVYIHMHVHVHVYNHPGMILTTSNMQPQSQTTVIMALACGNDLYTKYVFEVSQFVGNNLMHERLTFRGARFHTCPQFLLLSTNEHFTPSISIVFQLQSPGSHARMRPYGACTCTRLSCIC